jgi:hypothetical protein
MRNGFLSVMAIGLIIALAPVSAQASVLVAYWNFNSGNTGTANSEWQPGPITASQGSGSIRMTSWGGTTSNFAGSTINALGSDAAGGSLSLVAGGPTAGPYPGNGTYIEIVFSMSGLTDLQISFATRGTATGFDTGQWSYSTDGTTFINFGLNTATRDTSFAQVGPFGPSGLDHAATAYLRYTLSGATSNSGNNRVDNLQLTAVPEPASLGLLGLTGLLVMRRRR